MICFRDRTYCGSPNCTNECGRKMSKEEEIAALKSDLPISFAMFCDQVSEEEYYLNIKRRFENVAAEQ